MRRNRAYYSLSFGGTMMHIKTIWMIAAALVVFFAGVMRADAASMSAIYDSYSNTNLYLVGGTSSTWAQTEAQAQALGGNLITIHSAAEDTFVANTFFANFTSQGGPNLSNGYALWMGLYDPTGIIADDGSKHAADFVWVNGETNTYRNWAPFEPDNGNGGPHEYYGTMWGPDAIAMTGGAPGPTGTWNDSAALYPGPLLPPQGFYGVAEVPVPEPATMGVVGLAIALTMRQSRPGTKAKGVK
jgi:hypothetical protein